MKATMVVTRRMFLGGNCRRTWLAALVALSSALAACASAASREPQTEPPRLVRETLSFDLGWKHRAGLHDWPSDPNAPPINTTASGKSWIDPGASPAEASKEYIACDWIDVRLPHDGLISNPFGNAPSQTACPDGCSGRSYIPRHVLWYRKTFRLPTEEHHHSSSNNNTLPSWQDQLLEGTSRISLRFDGSFRNTTVYLNGRRIFQHDAGYTPFRIELTPENLGLLEAHSKHGSSTRDNSIHTIAVFVDPNNGDNGGPARGSGWWYEGGGLYRHVWLEKTPRSARIAPREGVFVTSRVVFRDAESPGDSTPTLLRRKPPPTTAVGATLQLRATFEIENVDEPYSYRFSVGEGEDTANGHDDNDDASGKSQFPTLQTPRLPLNISSSRKYQTATTTARATVTVEYDLLLANPIVWTSAHPFLYRVTAQLYQGTDTGTETATAAEPVLVDQVSVHHGIRATRFDPDTGFYWNHVPYKIRGFCDHDTFAVVGMAVPDRINLFRAQASRSIGGNARRASHNPPDPAVLDIYDRLGMVVIDENRLFDNNTAYVHNMAELVLRDRNHPSVIVWSFCNEVSCEGDHEAGGPAFQEITTRFDGSRPTLANMFTFHDLLSDTIDLQGFSHRHRDVLDQCHADLPDKPIVQSECCSCNTMRDTDEGCETMADNPHTTCDQKSFNGRCLETLVNASDGTEYASGTFVWTLLDYYGEPPSKPLTVSSTYGQFDLCGFPKASAFWFRSQWLLSQPREFLSLSNQDASIPMTTDRRHLGSSASVGTSAIANGRPFETNNLVEVHIVESWESPDHWNQTKGNTTRTIHVYSNAPVVELFVQGKQNHGGKPTSLGRRTLVPMVEGDAGTYGEWQDIPWEPGSLLAIAQSLDGTELARTRRQTNPSDPNMALRLSLDSPSPHTGTGSALFLDGSDVALVRATLVDADTNQTLVFADGVVNFTIVQGPGRILGTANGDPKSKRSHTIPYHPTHHGLVRAVVGVTSMAGWSPRETQLLSSMQVPAPEHCGKALPNNPYSFTDDRDIVIEATYPNLPPVRLIIPTSTDRKDSVLAVAARGAGRPVDLVMG